MEVTPEVYAWMISLNIIDGYKSMKVKSDGNVIISNFNENSGIEIASTFSGYFSDLLLTTNNGSNTFTKKRGIKKV